MSVDTPWGKAQHTTAIADGIIEYQTASHGGIKISEERFENMPEPFKSIAPFAGRLWYEEDADWALIALAFPEAYGAGMEPTQFKRLLRSAQKTFETYHAPRLEAQADG